MGFDIINRIKKEKGLTNAQIAEMSGVTLSTLDKITSGKNTNPKLDTLQAICRVLGCSLDDFDEPNAQESKKAPSISDEAMKLAKDYDALDTWGRTLLRSVADHELKRKKAETTENGKVLELPSRVYIHEIASRNGGFTTECMTSEQEEAQDAQDDSRPDFQDDL